MRGMEVRLSVSVRRLFLVPPGLRKNAADRLQLLPGSATWLAGPRQSLRWCGIARVLERLLISALETIVLCPRHRDLESLAPSG
jgi:hypothetical protein